MEIHRILGEKVRIYRRRDGGNWHCCRFSCGSAWNVDPLSGGIGFQI